MARAISCYQLESVQPSSLFHDVDSRTRVGAYFIEEGGVEFDVVHCDLQSDTIGLPAKIVMNCDYSTNDHWFSDEERNSQIVIT
jgi:hypothetical protein